MKPLKKLTNEQRFLGKISNVILDHTHSKKLQVELIDNIIANYCQYSYDKNAKQIRYTPVDFAEFIDDECEKPKRRKRIK